MTVDTTKAAPAVGCYDLRGPDFETILVGPSIPAIHDADRMVQLDWRNGFPNWALYRTVCAGDTQLREPLFCFCVGFAIAYGQEGGVSRKVMSDELGYAVGRDVYHRLISGKWEFPSEEAAKALGIGEKTYRVFRAATHKRMAASLDEYWIRLTVAIRQVYIVNRRTFAPIPEPRYANGRGFDPDEIDTSGIGAFRAMPRGSGC